MFIQNVERLKHYIEDLEELVHTTSLDDKDPLLRTIAQESQIYAFQKSIQALKFLLLSLYPVLIEDPQLRSLSVSLDKELTQMIPGLGIKAPTELKTLYILHRRNIICNLDIELFCMYLQSPLESRIDREFCPPSEKEYISQRTKEDLKNLSDFCEATTNLLHNLVINRI